MKIRDFFNSRYLFPQDIYLLSMKKYAITIKSVQDNGLSSDDLPHTLELFNSHLYQNGDDVFICPSKKLVMQDSTLFKVNCFKYYSLFHTIWHIVYIQYYIVPYPFTWNYTSNPEISNQNVWLGIHTHLSLLQTHTTEKLRNRYPSMPIMKFSWSTRDRV